MKFQHKTQMLHRKSSFENSVDFFTTFKFHKIIKSREITRAYLGNSNVAESKLHNPRMRNSLQVLVKSGRSSGPTVSCPSVINFVIIFMWVNGIPRK